MNRNKLIEEFQELAYFNDAYSPYIVGSAIGCDYSDKHLYLENFNFEAVNESKLLKIVEYMRAAREAWILGENL